MKAMQTIASFFLATLVLSCSSPVAGEPEDSSSNTTSDPVSVREVLLDVGEEHLYVVNDTDWGGFAWNGWSGPFLSSYYDPSWSKEGDGVSVELGINKIGTKLVLADSRNLSDLYVSVEVSRVLPGTKDVSYAVYATHTVTTEGTVYVPGAIGQVTLETNPYYRYPGNPYYGSDGELRSDAPVNVSISETVLHRVQEHVPDNSITWPDTITIKSAVFQRK